MLVRCGVQDDFRTGRRHDVVEPLRIRHVADDRPRVRANGQVERDGMEPVLIPVDHHQ